MDTKQVRGWLTIIYKVPSSPSTARVTVWKRTKELGALPLQQSVYILPNLPGLRDAVGHLKEQIQQFGGECKLLEIASLEEAQEKEIRDGFNHLRNQEYEEVIEEGHALLHEIDRESKAEKFSFAELEEIEKRLQGLKEWFNTIIKRDFFGADLREKASGMLKGCGDKFDGFSQEVFSREEAVAKDSKIRFPALKLKAEGKEGRRKVREVCSRDQLIARLKEVIDKLENNSLNIGDETVGNLPESAALELKYKTRRGEKALEIEIEWSDSERENPL